MHARRREGAVEGEEQALRTTSGKIGWKKREARDGTAKLAKVSDFAEDDPSHSPIVPAPWSRASIPAQERGRKEPAPGCKGQTERPQQKSHADTQALSRV